MKKTPFEIGDKVFVKTVTYHLTGKVSEIVGDFIKLEEAAMIADSGRFADALKNSEFYEVEPYHHPVWVNQKAVTEFTYIEKLPRTQK